MEEFNFEESMEKLEKIAQELEKDDLSLDESVEKFEQGMELSKNCKKMLDTAEKKITILVDGEEKEFSTNQE